MNQRELFAASKRMRSIDGWDAPVSKRGKQIAPEIQKRLAQLDTALESGFEAVDSWDLTAAERALASALDLSYDAPQLQELQQKMVDLTHNPEYIDRELARVGLDPDGATADAGNGVNSPPFWSYVLKIMGPVAMVDFLLSDAPSKSFDDFVTVYLTILILMGLLYWVGRIGLTRGKKWPLVAATIVFVIGVSGLSMIFSVIAAVVYAFRINSYQGRRDPARNEDRRAFISRARGFFSEQGLTPQSGLIVRYIGGGRGEIMLPPTPNNEFTISGKVQYAGDSRAPQPGDLYLFDGGGGVQAIAKSVGGEKSLLTVPKQLTQ